MRPLDYPLLADENISPHVLKGLRGRGLNVQAVTEAMAPGATDRDVVDHATQHGMVVLTHDSDFGTLVAPGSQPYVGIIYLRPGHLKPAFVLDIIDQIQRVVPQAYPPFILVAERRGETIRIRLRQHTG